MLLPTRLRRKPEHLFSRTAGASTEKVTICRLDVDYIQAQIDSSVSGNSVSKYNKKLKEKKESTGRGNATLAQITSDLESTPNRG